MQYILCFIMLFFQRSCLNRIDNSTYVYLKTMNRTDYMSGGAALVAIITFVIGIFLILMIYFIATKCTQPTPAPKFYIDNGTEEVVFPTTTKKIRQEKQTS